MTKFIQICIFILLLSAGITTFICIQAFGTRPLWFLVGTQSYKMASILLALGADPNQCENRSGDCPLLTAVVFEDIKMIKILEHYGADVHILNKHHHNVLLANCSSTTMLEYFLSKKVDVNNQAIGKDGKPGFAALHCAVFANKPEAVKLLLAYGANKKAGMTWQGKQNVTPLQLAQLKGYKDLVSLLK